MTADRQDGASGLYCFSWGNQFYERWRDGRPVSLADCLDACYGVFAARIWRINTDETLTLVVEDAGSATEITHVPTGRPIRRRRPYGAQRPSARAA
ncbi:MULTISPECIES: hypothetical protein [Asanoa]|uniref:Uncharacterized protein n=2 Tax=Asanoa TaxID=195964 RepID=A0A239PGE3_9ACTN|nr:MULTISPECIES: hypothetical protein [Asanoa]GIF74162.1 hypothetical protein Asi02nite_36800 [Asanoa siamensis]SNT65678.1 hypothetical protein SAMN05421812_12521 [Asanoa hainanensis]